MPHESVIVAPHGAANSRSVRTPQGQVLTAPADWVLVPPGDPGLTRRVKAAGPSWTVQEKRRNKMFSLGVWASGPIVAKIKADLAVERADPAYAKKQAAAAVRREVKQTAYVEDFRGAVVAFLRFAPKWESLGVRMADLVAAHATPVGSGTVARTERIPIERRAEAAVIAWMRHQTTGYDDMKIARVKGKRREVRRELAERSRRLLDGYRRGFDIDATSCPLQCAVTQSTKQNRGPDASPLASKPSPAKPATKKALIAQAVERQLAQRKLAQQRPADGLPSASRPRPHSQGT